MKNVEKWRPYRCVKDENGKIIGPYMQRIIGNTYEPVIIKYAKGQLADIGSSNVPYYHFYKDLITDNTCVDWGNSLSENSFLDYEADLNKGLDFLANDSFDTVLCTDVLEHIYRPEVLFSEMARILKPNGNIIVGVPFMYWIHEDPHDYHRYTHNKLKEFCTNNNLEVVQLNAYGGLPEIIFDLIQKGYGYYNFPLKKMFYFFWNGFGKFMSKRKFVQRLSVNSRSTFPMGYVLVAVKK
jgi:SAM-dependent methyltransferase